MDELVAFLRAALDRDEQVITAACLHIDDCNDSGIADLFGEDRMLAEVQAKRAILDAYERALQRQADNSARFVRMTDGRPSNEPDYLAVKTHGWELGGHVEGLRWAITLLAQPYAGQDGWREEWAL